MLAGTRYLPSSSYLASITLSIHCSLTYLLLNCITGEMTKTQCHSCKLPCSPRRTVLINSLSFHKICLKCMFSFHLPPYHSSLGSLFVSFETDPILSGCVCQTQLNKQNLKVLPDVNSIYCYAHSPSGDILPPDSNNVSLPLIIFYHFSFIFPIRLPLPLFTYIVDD